MLRLCLIRKNTLCNCIRYLEVLLIGGGGKALWKFSTLFVSLMIPDVWIALDNPWTFSPPFPLPSSLCNNNFWRSCFLYSFVSKTFLCSLFSRRSSWIDQDINRSCNNNNNGSRCSSFCLEKKLHSFHRRGLLGLVLSKGPNLLLVLYWKQMSTNK